MKKRLLTLSATVLWMAATTVYAQAPKKGNSPAKAEKEISKATNSAQLKRLANEFGKAHAANKQRALELAKQKNWPVRQVSKTGQVLSLEGVDSNGFPVYYATDNNTRAAASVKADQLWAGGSTGLNLSGSNPALSGKLGVWDGGLIRGTHQELTGRMVNRDNATTISGHATHVAGTMVASGVNPLAKGMSFGAPNLQGWDFSNDVAEIAAAAPGLLISNHSYGTITGWYYNDTRAGTTTNPYWEFYANQSISTTEDLNFGYYDTKAQSWDRTAYNAPYYLIVKSAGNNRNQTGPAVGQPFWKISSTNTWVLETSRPAGISSNNGYDIISTYGTAKNILTVGAVEPIPFGYQKKEDVIISSFSSWGPTDDGRIKPDIVANGVALTSAYNTADNSYASLNGTSMAAPNASGTLNLLQEHYFNTTGGFMRAATLKGLAIHTADEAGNTGPDYIFGWGLLNAERAANHITNTGGTNLLQERTLEQGQTYTFNVVASGKGPLVVTISWTDVEGQVLTANTTALNNRSPRLVNDLDIRIANGLTTYMPWILDPANPANPAGLGDNFRDNVEQVYIANAVPGETYTITVSHKGTLTSGPQAYSILASGIGGGAYCVSGATTDGDAKINNFTFANINNTPAAGCATYRNFTNLIAAVEPGQTLPLSVTLGTCGDENARVAKVYIDWNADNDFDDAGELVATSDVVSTTTIYTTNITVPASVATGTQSRIRVVLAETTDADDVTSCGGYLKGETQDYMIRFNQRSKDVGITALLYPEQTFCGNTELNVAVNLRNFGTVAQTNIPVTVVVSESGNTIATLTGTFTGPLASFSETKYFLPGTFNAEAGKTYTFTSYTSLTGDLNAGNNQNVATRTVSSYLDAPVAEANKCGTGPLALRGTGAGTIFWYDAMTGGNLVAAGNNVSKDNAPAVATVYAALNDFYGTVPSANYNEGGAQSSFSNGRMYFDAEVPFILEKATINVGAAGTMTVDLLDKNLSSSIVATTTINVEPGVSEYILNLPVPAAGKNYTLMVSAFGGGATAYRNNTTNSAAYPLTIPNVVSFTGNNGSIASSFYYFFYNIKVKAAGCASPRVAVPVNQAAEATASITAASATTFCTGGSVVLSANQGANYTYAWFKNGAAIANATTTSYTANSSGSYTVQVTNELGCSVTSAAVSVVVNPLPPTSISISQDLNLNLCLGENFSQTLRAVTSTTHSSFTYQWFNNGVPIANANSATYNATANGSYTVQLSSPCGGTITSAPVTITNDAAQITAQAAETCQGSNATLTAQTTSGKLYWFDAATGGNLVKVGNSYTTPNLTQSRNYFVAASNETIGTLGSSNHSSGGGASSINSARMYFNASVPFVLEKATINVATAGTMTVVITDKNKSNAIISSVTITVTTGVKEYNLGLIVPAAGNDYGVQVASFGGGATAYRNNATGSTAYPYDLPGIASITGTNQSSPTGFYYFLYDWQVSAASCQTAARVAIPVTVSPTTVAGTLTASATAVCTGNNSGTITLSGNSGNVVNWESSTDGTTWTTIASTSTSLPFDNLTVTTSYRAVVKSGSCTATTTQAVTVTVNPATVAGTLTASVAQVCSGTNSGTVTLVGQTGNVVQWESSTDGSNWTVIAQTAATLNFSDLTSSTSYRALVKSGACTEAYTGAVAVTVNVLPTAEITASGALTFCQGGSVILTATEGQGYTYLWSNGAITRSIEATQSGNYTVTVTSPSNCSVTSAATTVSVTALPSATITTSGSTTICEGQTVTLSAPAGANYTYLWSNGAITQSIETGTTGNYTVTVTGAGGCTVTSEAVAVTVNALPVAAISADGPTAFCQGGSVTLTATAGTSYLWSNGATTRSITVTTSGSYTVTVTNENGCSATSQARNVNVNQVPARPSIVHNGNNLSSSEAEGNQWYLNGIAIAGATSQNLTVTQSGIYSVKITNASSCASPFSEEVNVTITALNKEHAAINGLQVYPNPTTGKFTVSFTVTKTEKVKLVLVNSIGQILFEDTQSRTAGSHEQQVSLYNLPTGVYYLQVHTNGKVLNKKVVVKS
ncbi:Ig-like domain-containing protein [Pontibacter cellulosilyticus]|uniref:S8 family serine peptidase n=1 Tax=Pontibacter cellulosilyticus TaxID=1720253 RepID=A0A923SPK9_9BACT|nr:S8 family serine peptidase [Pontibacter cellulosilyticus]MBC5994255.1 S8 family serine peptidase [Pontibacter cellulosilyticus]